MNPIREFIESGVLELYVMGAATPEQALKVESMAAAHPLIREELDAIEKGIELYARAQAVEPNKMLKPMLLASVDYMERMKQGELPSAPPVLTRDSTQEDYAQWLDREDMVLPSDADHVFAKIIGYTPAASTAIVWIKDKTGSEVHHDEYERFLILEGTCDMIVKGNRYKLSPGDFFDVPLQAPHRVEITSNVPCKAILQRVRVT